MGGSYLETFYEQNEYYFSSGVSFNVYTKDFDYFEAQASFVKLHQRLMTEKFMDISAGLSDWHHSFMADNMLDPLVWPMLECFTTTSSGDAGAAVTLDSVNSLTPEAVHCLFTDHTEFYQALMTWFEVGGFNLLSSNIQWVDSSCDECNGDCALDINAPLCSYNLGINASRIEGTLRLNATDSGQQRYDTMTALRLVVAECFPTYESDGVTKVETVEGVYNSNELAFPYARQFENWEEVGIIDSELWKNLLICFGVILVIIFVLIPKPRVSIFVIIAIVMSIVDILGFLFFWGVTISGVSTIFILVSVGLAVDYSAHIAHMFAESKGTARERAIGALERIGPSVFNAIFSTLLAVIVLSTSTSFIYQVFFKVLCLTVLFAGAHGLWFLPVILALGGGDFLTDLDKFENSEQQKDTNEKGSNEKSTNEKGANDKDVSENQIDFEKGVTDDDDVESTPVAQEEGDAVERTTVTA